MNAAFLIQLAVCWLAASVGTLVLVTLLFHGAAAGERRQRWARPTGPEVAIPSQHRPRIGQPAPAVDASR